MLPSTYACFLTHDWGRDEDGRDNHERVDRACHALEAAGLRTWFDAKEMHGEINAKMAEGVDASEVIVVFITKRYCEKVGGKGSNRSDDNCKFEYDLALLKKGVGRMVPVVMERRCRNPKLWSSAVSGKLGPKIHVDMTSDDGEAFAKAITHLISEIEHAMAESLPDGVVTHPRRDGATESAPEFAADAAPRAPQPAGLDSLVAMGRPAAPDLAVQPVIALEALSVDEVRELLCSGTCTWTAPTSRSCATSRCASTTRRSPRHAAPPSTLGSVNSGARARPSRSWHWCGRPSRTRRTSAPRPSASGMSTPTPRPSGSSLSS
jgi:hypothetical protein